MHARPARHWSWLITLLKVALSALAFGIVAFSVDLSAAWEHAANQSVPYIAVSAFILSLQLLLGGLRWHTILVTLGANPSIRGSVRLYYISAFFNSYLWGAVGGDVLRAWLTYRRELSAQDCNQFRRAGSCCGARWRGNSGLGHRTDFPGACWEYASHVHPPCARLRRPCRDYDGGKSSPAPDRLARHKIHALPSFARQFGAQVFFSPKAALSVLAFALAAQVALGIATFAMAASLGINASMIDCIVLMQPVALLANLPISVGGWGVRETAVVLLFGLIGVPSAGTRPFASTRPARALGRPPRRNIVAVPAVQGARAEASGMICIVLNLSHGIATKSL